MGNNRARPTRVLGLNPADSSRIPIIATFILQKINASLLQVCRAPRIAAFPARGERRDQGSARWSDDLRAGVDGARWRRRCGRWAPHDRIAAVPTISAFAIAFFCGHCVPKAAGRRGTCGNHELASAFWSARTYSLTT